MPYTVLGLHENMVYDFDDPNCVVHLVLTVVLDAEGGQCLVLTSSKTKAGGTQICRASLEQNLLQ